MSDEDEREPADTVASLIASAFLMQNPPRSPDDDSAFRFSAGAAMFDLLCAAMTLSLGMRHEKVEVVASTKRQGEPADARAATRAHMLEMIDDFLKEDLSDACGAIVKAATEGVAAELGRRMLRS